MHRLLLSFLLGYAVTSCFDDRSERYRLLDTPRLVSSAGLRLELADQPPVWDDPQFCVWLPVNYKPGPEDGLGGTIADSTGASILLTATGELSDEVQLNFNERRLWRSPTDHARFAVCFTNPELRLGDYAKSEVRLRSVTIVAERSPARVDSITWIAHKYPDK